MNENSIKNRSFLNLKTQRILYTLWTVSFFFFSFRNVALRLIWLNSFFFQLKFLYHKDNLMGHRERQKSNQLNQMSTQECQKQEERSWFYSATTTTAENQQESIRVHLRSSRNNINDIRSLQICIWNKVKQTGTISFELLMVIIIYEAK